MKFLHEFNLRKMKVLCLLVVAGIFCIYPAMPVHAAGVTGLETPSITGATQNQTNIREPGEAQTPEELAELNIANNLTVTVSGDNGSLNSSLRILITLTLIALAPTLIIMLTSFTRIIIVLHFTRNALGTMTAPSNQILIGLALFLTFFIMHPVITEINENAIQPMNAGQITQEEALELGMEPLREFMYGETLVKDVRMFMDIAGLEWTTDWDEVPNSVLIPSFIVSELRTAFIIGFVIYIPFIVIDMVISSALMSMGMMMLPPTTISMPFKILLFVLADGWNLVIGNVVKTFY